MMSIDSMSNSTGILNKPVMEQLTISKRFRNAVVEYQRLESSGERNDSVLYQTQLSKLVHELKLITSIVEELHLFSDNEGIEEVSVKYLPFLNCEFYLGGCYTNGNVVVDGTSPLGISKSASLNLARLHLIQFLVRLQAYNLLSKAQSGLINLFKELYNPTLAEIITTNPTTRRQEKIENYKLEKELRGKLSILDDYYSSNNADDDLENFDEEIVSKIYTDQLRLHILNAFGKLESLTMELQVISNKSEAPPTRPQTDSRVPSRENDYGYTSRLETLPLYGKEISDLLSKQGKILQPFTITSKKQQLKDKVFGTGQVLPSMSVEEYLDYELANGKMVSEEVQGKNESDSDDEDDELEKRQWDDWKDDNPKGAGNTKANIG